MDTKSLLIGILSFIAGGLLVSTAAVTFDKPERQAMGMASMTESLEDKSCDDFDKEFLSQMIARHEGAVEMAKLSKDKARHDEIRKLSDGIIAAQEKEIAEMKKWQAEWGYAPANTH